MFGQDGIPISAVQIRCDVAEDTLTLIPEEHEGLIRLFVVHRMGRHKKVLKELHVEYDNPQHVYDHQLLHAFSVRMSETAITADMTFVETNLVRSVVLLHYAGTDSDDPHYWLWTDDRKVMMGGSFEFPSVYPEAFLSTGGFPISTWGGTGGIVLPRLENNINAEDTVEESDKDSVGESDKSDEESDESGTGHG
jgi:hypothetical protein